MKSAFSVTAIASLLALSAVIGCNKPTDTVTNPPGGEPSAVPLTPDQPLTADDKAYTVRGVVTQVDRDEPSATVDHEEIEGFMQAMTMKFHVADAQLLEGIEEGDRIEGRLVDRDGQYVLEQLSEVAQ